MIRCTPRWFSATYDISGPDFSAVARFRFFSEQGTIEIDGVEYEIVKHGPFSGQWSMSGSNQEVAVGRKDSVLTRSISINSRVGALTLQARSIFSRVMVLHGNEVDAVILPRGFFTRGFTMTGQVPHPDIVCFVFWLAGMLDRRRRRNNN